MSENILFFLYEMTGYKDKLLDAFTLYLDIIICSIMKKEVASKKNSFYFAYLAFYEC